LRLIGGKITMLCEPHGKRRSPLAKN
jgi:hypothetical protein